MSPSCACVPPIPNDDDDDHNLLLFAASNPITLQMTCFVLFTLPPPASVCSCLVNVPNLSSVNRYNSNCNNNSQHSHEEEDEEEPAEAKRVAAEEEGAQAVAGTSSEEATIAQKLEEAIMTTILPRLVHPVVVEASDSEATDKLSCHDSGIDIRDPAILQQLLPQLHQNKLPQAPPKKYSDADIVLSDDWVPPVPLVTPLGGSSGPSHLSAVLDPHPHHHQGHDRKKASSVSFSVEEAEPQHSSMSDKGGADKKNKVWE